FHQDYSCMLLCVNGSGWDLQWDLRVATASPDTSWCDFLPTLPPRLSYGHSSNRTEKTAFLLRCFCRRKVAFAVLVADEAYYEPIAGSPPAKGTTGSPPAIGATGSPPAISATATGTIGCANNTAGSPIGRGMAFPARRFSNPPRNHF